MAKIKVDAKAVEKPLNQPDKDGKTVWQDGEARILVFDEKTSDGISFTAFEELCEQQDEWLMLNTATTYKNKDGKKESYSAREAKLVSGQEGSYDMRLTIKHLQTDEQRHYSLRSEVVNAFSVVAKHTRMNTRETTFRNIHLRAVS
jgi:hypothetical protein